MSPSSSLPHSSPSHLSPSHLSQWQRLLKNVGIWQGSFTQVSATGEILSDKPTEVALIPQDDGKAMHQEVRFYAQSDYTDEPKVEAFDYRSLNRTIRFFEDGSFSQGSTQWGPFSEFGAELGFIAGERRLRQVPLFDTTGAFKQLTLIRERQQGSQASERATLQISDLLGTWQGKAVTQYADLRPDQTQDTQLTLDQLSDSEVHQTITLSGLSPISSTGTPSRQNSSQNSSQNNGQSIKFQDGSQPVTVLLLPDGASATFPPHITPRQPLFLEAGWLIDAKTRQRMIRRYDASGAWVSVTLVTEHKA